jgi:hypothetical protein
MDVSQMKLNTIQHEILLRVVSGLYMDINRYSFEASNLPECIAFGLWDMSTLTEGVYYTLGLHLDWIADYPDQLNHIEIDPHILSDQITAKRYGLLSKLNKVYRHVILIQGESKV